MQEYRAGDKVDNVADLMQYLEEKGYLRLTGQPDHALAALQLAETFHMKDLYLQSLTHCVGMRAMLPNSPDFEVSCRARRICVSRCQDFASIASNC
jgi:hypothetical protein